MLPPSPFRRSFHDIHQLLDAREVQEPKASERGAAVVKAGADDKGDGIKNEGAELSVQSLACQDEGGDVVAAEGAAGEKRLDGRGGAEVVIGLVGWEEVELVDGETDFGGEEEERRGELGVHFGRGVEGGVAARESRAAEGLGQVDQGWGGTEVGDI